MKGRVLALDIGSKRTGIAVCDELRIIASPRSYVLAEDLDDWVKKIKEVIEEENPVEILVGIPMNQQGQPGPQAENIRRYVTRLKDETSLPIKEWDESYTTVQATQVLIEADVSRRKRKQLVDKVAASFLLQAYINQPENS